MTNKPKLTIVGDGWIYGTWRREQNESVPDQPGMSAILSDHYDVNLVYHDFPTESLRSGIWAELGLLQSIDLEGTVIVFQGNTANTHYAHHFGVRHEEIIKSSTNLRNLYSNIVDRWYSELDRIAAAAGKTIYLVGSATDIDTAVLMSYPNLACVCSSWIKLMYPEHVSTPVMLGYVRDSFQDLELTFERMGRHDLLNEQLMTNDPWRKKDLLVSEGFTLLMGRDGLMPTQQAHRAVAQEILQHFELA
jgi:hypothetical protein